MKLGTSLDLAGNQIIAPVLENLASNPAGSKRGQFWLNTTTSFPTFWDGDTNQQIATVEWVNGALSGAGAGDMLKSQYDTNNDGKVDVAALADAAPWSGITGKPATYAPSVHTHLAAEISDFTAAANTAIAAYVQGEAGGDTLLDTVGEIIAQIQENAEALTSLTLWHNETIAATPNASFPITHNFGTTRIHVSLWDSSGEQVWANVTRTSANVVTIGFTEMDPDNIEVVVSGRAA